MQSTAQATHQELTSSLKSGGNSSNSHSDVPYGSVHEGADDILILKSNQQSRCNSPCLFKWIPLIFSIAALAISIIIFIMVSEVRNNNEDTMNLAQSTEQAIGHLSRNAILSQFAFEQRIRSDGDSGITNTRQYNDGDAIYDDGTYSNGAVSAIHDHADFINTAGMGELQAVLNGVEFQTRHNDYSLEMPSTKSMEYGETEPIPQPNVPPEVTNAGNITQQIAEMQEWFRAFKTQNKSHRYYPDYFKPILCYLEGTWIMDEGILEEPFDSDRHSIDASTWKELHDKIRYMVNSGRKDPLENLAHLPSSIRNLIDDIYPVISNWEYRILCHPLKNDVPTDRFRVSDDLSVQLLNSPLTREELRYSRRARFEMSKYINLTDPDGELYGINESYPDGYWQSGIKTWNYLDYLMEQVPGKDNYLANLTDVLPGDIERVIHYNDEGYINSGYYNRFFSLDNVDAMGATRQKRAYNDRYMFTAQTTQDRVSPISMIWTDPEGEQFEVESKQSYAIPLEIIYTTPLRDWNPYNIKYIPFSEFSFESPTGSCDANDPLEGWSDFRAYYTPSEFYERMGTRTGADTARSGFCALDENGISRSVFASGHWITFPSIGGGVGVVRQRYPIPPLHKSGDLGFKEVKALQAVILDEDYDDPINGAPIFGEQRDRIYGFELNLMGGGHEHTMYIPGWMVNNYWYDDVNEVYLNGSEYKLLLDTSVANMHEHAVELWRWRADDSSDWNYVIEQCAWGTTSDPTGWMDGECECGNDVIIRELA